MSDSPSSKDTPQGKSQKASVPQSASTQQQAVAQELPAEIDVLVAPEQTSAESPADPVKDSETEASADPRQLARLTLPESGPISGLGFRSDASFVAVTERGLRVEYREQASGWREEHRGQGKSSARYLAVADTGQVAIGLDNGKVLLSSATGRSLAAIELDGPAVRQADFNQAGWLAACTGSERVWKWAPGDSTPHVVDTSPRPVCHLAWASNDELIVAGEHKLQRLKRSGPSAVENELAGAPICRLAVSPASRVVAVARADSAEVVLLDSEDLTYTGLSLTGQAKCTALAFTGDGGFILVGDSAGFLNLHSLLDGSLVERWRAHDHPITALAFARDDTRALSGSEHGEIGIWRVDETRPSLPVLKSDLEHGDDALQIDRDVRAFARVILARDLRPPMAIGIFGDWGTGKSFFLERMRARIDEECGRATEVIAAGETSPYVGHTAQITFNAWHYMEGNLWASMMAHLFDKLGERFRPDEPAAKTRRDLINALETTQAAKQAAKERRATVERRLASAREQERALREKVERERSRQQQLHSSEILPMAGKVLFGILDKKTKTLRGDMGEQVDTATAEWRSTLASLRTTRGRIWMLWKWAWTTKRLWIVLALVIGLGALGAFVAHKLGLTSDNILYVLATALGPVAVLGRSLANVWRIIEEPLDAALDHLEENRTLVDAANKERLEKAMAPLSADLERASAELASAETELARMQDSYDRINLELEEAQAAVVDADEGRRLLRFLGERAETKDYRQHLGTISLIKRDLDTLANFLSPKERAPEAGSDTDEPVSESVGERAHLDRIVLYIDDLDRCPPKRVVEVLQAVHLLLGMRLFVVVVAVDSRWLMRSLDEHYADLLGGNERDENREIRRSTPHNYLEKIFQIPYVLAPMDAHGFGRLVTGLAATRTPGAPDERAVQSAWVAPDTGSGEGAVGDGAGTSARDTESSAAVVPAPLGVQAARMTDDELSFMRALHPLMATPRSVKAFVNIYRLVRARLEEPHVGEPSLATYLREGEYPVALLMLAVQVGKSRQAGLLCADLVSAGRPTDIDAFIAERIAVTGDDQPANAIAGQLSASEAEAWRIIAERMSHLRTVASLPAKTAPYALWAQRMRRFSFDPWRQIGDAA